MDPEKREAFKAERREEERERIAASVRELTTSEGWQRWIETRSKFRTYSLCNQLLIACQRPEATQVAGYRAWQSMSRQVRRGEKGIRIMAPMACKSRKRGERQGAASAGLGASVAQQVAAGRRSLTETDGSTSDDGETRLLFRSVSVFDVSQTEGEPLSEPPVTPIEGDELAGYLPKLEAFARELGLSVEFRDLTESPAKGWHDPRTGQIVVDSTGPANARVRVFVHELAHALGVGYRDYGRADAEVIVESITLIACGALGLDTSGESIPYVATFGGGDVAAIREHAATVDKLAKRLEDALGVDVLGLAVAA